MRLALAVLVFCWTATAQAALPRGQARQVRAFVDRWVAAQNGGDFAAYRALYAPAFTGVRRSGEKTVTLDRDGWLKDRERMFKKKMTVRIGRMEIESEGALVEVGFTQLWESGSYRDVGHKVLQLQAGPKGLLLVREELLSSDRGEALPAEVAPLEAWKAKHQAALQRKEPGARFKVRSVTYLDHSSWALDAKGLDENVMFAFVEGRTEGAACRVSLRKLDVEWSATGKGLTVKKDTLVGEDCCGDAPCPERTPGGWLLHIVNACGELRFDAVAGFIDEKDGVTFTETLEGGGEHAQTSSSERKIRKRDPQGLCRALQFPFDCPPAFDGESASCDADGRGERWSFRLRKRRSQGDVVVDSVDYTYMN